MHPEQLAALNRQRHAEIARDLASARGFRRHHHLGHLATRLARRVRCAAGWLLVDAGLRLAVRGRETAETP